MAKRSSMVQAGAAGAVAAGAAGVAAAAKVAHDRRVRRRRAFRVGDGEDTATATRRIARGQIDLASERLAQSSGDGLGEAVHDARKRLKRLRAVLKLVRDDVGDPVYRRENAKFRDLGRALSGPRDAKVLAQTLDAVSRDGEYARLRASLAAEHEAAYTRLANEPAAVATLVAELRAARGRLARWPLSREDPGAVLVPGFARAYRAGRRAERAARKKPDDERLHELRKRTKDLWHAAQIVRPLAPKPMGKVVKRAHELADLLGDDHDLAVLLATARDRRAELADGELDRLQKEVGRRRKRLQRRALKRARRVYRRRPRRLAAQLSAGAT